MTDRPLREALLIDGVLSGLTGLVATPLAGVLAEPLGLPTSALLVGGLCCVAYAAALLVAATRRVVSRRFAAVVVDINVVSALGSAVLAIVAPLTTAGGVVFVALAVALVVLATVQWRALGQGKPAKIEVNS